MFEEELAAGKEIDISEKDLVPALEMGRCPAEFDVDLARFIGGSAAKSRPELMSESEIDISDTDSDPGDKTPSLLAASCSLEGL